MSNLGCYRIDVGDDNGGDGDAGGEGDDGGDDDDDDDDKIKNDDVQSNFPNVIKKKHYNTAKAVLVA